MVAYILQHEVGLRVAIRLPHSSERGTITAVTKNRVTVLSEKGEWRTFSRHSGTEVGATGHKWLRPYICTVAEAEERDRARAAANERAGKRIAEGTSPDWSVVKGMSY